MRPFSNLHIRQSCMTLDIITINKEQKQNPKLGRAKTSLKSDLFDSFNVVLYYNIVLKLIAYLTF
jgi:hypothetical protein